jgi:plasmid stabilization system protein ParE
VIQKSYLIEEKPDVLSDYMAITEHVERWTDDRALADRTVDAIRNFIQSLKTVPHRGTKRDDLRQGLRIVPFKKRTAIAIQIDESAMVVTVLRVFYGGQDYESVLRKNRE